MSYRRRNDDGRGFTPSGGGFSPGSSSFAPSGGGFGPVGDGGGGGPAPPVYDLAGLLAYAQIAGYGSPSGGWMPNDAEPEKAAILARLSGRL